MRLVLALIFLFVTAGALRADVYVLCYHSFLGRENVAYDFSLDELKSHLMFLKDRGFKFISISDLTGGKVRGKRNILITIDDGNHSVYDAYYKVFKPMGIKPLLGIYTFILGHRDYALTWDKLKKLSDDGCDIASHGFFHLKLNDRLYREQKKQFVQEIAKSKVILEEKLQRKVDTFVYPFGLHSESAVATLKSSGYKFAFTIVNNPVRIPLSANKDPYRLPRYMLTRSLYQGSLNTIARLADRNEKNTVSSLPARGDSQAAVSRSAKAGVKIVKTETKSVPNASARSKTAKTQKDDIRYGAVYAKVNKERKIERKQGRSDSKKKRKTVKSDRKSAAVPPAELPRRHIQELEKINEYDLAYRYSISNPESLPGNTDTSPGVKEAGASVAEKSASGPGRPGIIKENWKTLSAGIIDFYKNFIAIKLRKASQYIRTILGYMSRSNAFFFPGPDRFFNC